jgi:hypothetical protein
MKALTAFFLFLLLLSDKPDTSKLYITQNLEGMIEILQFNKSDSVKYLLTKKYPKVNYDFFEEKNLKWFRTYFDTCGIIEKYKYTLKGDSIFLDRSDKVMLIVLSKGTFRNGVVKLHTTWSIVNNKANLEVIKTIPSQIFTPY